MSAAAEERRGAGEEPRRKAFEREMNEQACAGGEGAGGTVKGKVPRGERGTEEPEKDLEDRSSQRRSPSHPTGQFWAPTWKTANDRGEMPTELSVGLLLYGGGRGVGGEGCWLGRPSHRPSEDGRDWEHTLFLRSGG